MMYRLARISLIHPRVTLAILAVLSLVFAAGLPRVRPEFGFRVLLGGDHPSVRALEAFIAQFGGGLPIQIAWECGESEPCRSVFDANSLRMADEVTRALTALPRIRAVRGLSNSAILMPAPDGFAVRRLVENGLVSPDVDELSKRVLSDPLWTGTLVSPDAKVGVIVVQPQDIKNSTDVAVVDAIQATIAPFQERGFRFHLVGNAVSAVLSGRELAESMARIIPFTVAVIAITLFGMTRSWLYTTLSLATMGVALLWTFGLLGWLGWPRDAILEILAPLILVVGICDSIRVLSSREMQSPGAEPETTAPPGSAGILGAVRELGTACSATGLTTAAGFISFATSELETFVRFGLISAFGVMACLLLTFTLLPALAVSLPIQERHPTTTADQWQSATSALLRTTDRRWRLILVACAVLAVVGGLGWASRLRVDTYWYELVGEHSQVVRSIRFLEDRLRPSASLELEISLPENVSLEDPRTLERVSALSQLLPSVDGLGEATSFLNLIENVNQLLHNDDPSYRRFGSSMAANAEMLELISMDDEDLLSTWITLDRSKFRISVEAAEQSNERRRTTLEAVERLVGAELPANWKTSPNGGLAINFAWVRDVQNTQMRSFPAAFVLVFAMAAFFLRSLRLAALAMIPTLLPVLAVLGAMGWTGMSLDVGRAMIASIVIGVGVDDSIHILSQYRRVRGQGSEARESIRVAVMRTGRAVVTTSLALAFGFLTLTASAWQTLSSFGFFVSLAVLGALVATLLVLPSVVFAATENRQSED